ncbi:MAG: response regulator [Rhodocyclales bacterium]|nr:response regulator [Rhodocyclales bacterium]
MGTQSEEGDRILADQVREAIGDKNRAISSTVAANILASVLLVVAMHGKVPMTAILGWFLFQVSYQTLRLFVAKWYWHHQPGSRESVRRWAKILSALSIGSGCMWGLAGILFYLSDSTMHQALLAILLCGLTAGSIPANAMLMSGLLGSATAILGLFIVRLAWENDADHWLMVAMLTVYLGFVLNWGRGLNRVLVESLRRRHQNEDLLVQMRQQSEAALAAKHVAEDANTAKSKFLAAASHDLRQPMHALTLFSGALLNETRPAELKSLTHHIARSVEALEMLFNSLLDISRLDAGVTQPKTTNFLLENVFERLRNDFAHLAAEKNLRIHIRATDAVVRSDAQLLEQVLRNLLANAVRYTESGGIVVGCRKRKGAWRIDVADSGIGIPAAEHEKVFQEFYQIGNPERDRHKGLGLGLAIVRRLSVLLGLALSLRSRVGHGTVFTLQVPAGTVPTHLHREPTDAGIAFDALRVLIVDDEADVRLALGMLLRGWGCDVIEAESFAYAVAAMESAHWRPQFAIADLRLRNEQTGIVVLDWLRSRYDPNLPCIVITGDTAAEQLQEVASSGYRILHKPVAPAKLRALLRARAPA